MNAKTKKELDALTAQLKNKVNDYKSMATDTAYELGLFRGKASAYTDCIKWIEKITKEDKSK